MAIPAKKKKSYSLFGVGLSYSNPYGERAIIQQNLVDGVPYSRKARFEPCYGTKTRIITNNKKGLKHNIRASNAYK